MYAYIKDIGQAPSLCVHITQNFGEFFKERCLSFNHLKSSVMDAPKLHPFGDTANKAARNETKKYLTMPAIEVVRLLMNEKDAKNRAYQFIIDKGLIHEFKSFK